MSTGREGSALHPVSECGMAKTFREWNRQQTAGNMPKGAASAVGATSRHSITVPRSGWAAMLAGATSRFTEARSSRACGAPPVEGRQDPTAAPPLDGDFVGIVRAGNLLTSPQPV